MTRRKYMRELRLEAVRLANKQRLSFAEEVHDQQKPEQAEVAALKREIQMLKVDQENASKYIRNDYSYQRWKNSSATEDIKTL